MKSNNLTLGEILASPSQYVIPVFQRYYRWDQPQWDKLWSDLTGLAEPGQGRPALHGLPRAGPRVGHARARSPATT